MGIPGVGWGLTLIGARDFQLLPIHLYYFVGQVKFTLGAPYTQLKWNNQYQQSGEQLHIVKYLLTLYNRFNFLKVMILSY